MMQLESWRFYTWTKSGEELVERVSKYNKTVSEMNPCTKMNLILFLRKLVLRMEAISGQVHEYLTDLKDRLS